MEPETWLVKPWILDFGRTMLMLMAVSLPLLCARSYTRFLCLISHNRAICCLPAPSHSQARRQQRMVTRFPRGHTAYKAMDTRSRELTWCPHLLSALRACGSARGHSVCGSAQFQTPELAASRRIWPQSLPPSLFQIGWGKDFTVGVLGMSVGLSHL